MKTRSLILNICLFFSTGCLIAGYLLAGYWQILPILLGTLFLGVMIKKQQTTLPASSFLLVYIVLVAIGIVAGLSAELMIIACTFALVSWDLIQFEGSMAGNSTHQTDIGLEKYHLRSLTVAVVIGLLLALTSLYIHLHLSFGIIASLVLLALGCLTYSVQHIKKKVR